MLSLAVRVGVLVSLGIVSACEPASDVEVQPLPPLDIPTPEALMGLPEVTGVWRFAGWEVESGDSTTLSQPFPIFGELSIQVQRLDSLAGAFTLPGVELPVVGEIRRSGWVALATMSGNTPTAFITGLFQSDTLWLEMSSVVSAEEWPRNARAAFVETVETQALAWVRGTRPLPPPPPMDSLIQADSVAVGLFAGIQAGSSTGPSGLVSGSGPTPATPDSAARAGTDQPGGAAGTPPAPSATGPGPNPVAPPPAQTRPPPAPAPAPPPDDEPAVQPPDAPDQPPSDAQPEPEIPPLLGDPIRGR